MLRYLLSAGRDGGLITVTANAGNSSLTVESLSYKDHYGNRYRCVAEYVGKDTIRSDFASVYVRG